MDEKTSDFLEELSNKYRHCDSYQDSGLIQSSWTCGEMVFKRHCSFNTFYIRPGRLSIHIWSTEDESGLVASAIYKDGEVYAFRDGASIPALKCESLRKAIWTITSYRQNTTDHFELAVPALLEKELRLSCEGNFFDANCFLLQELNSKYHLQKTEGPVLTDIWFRADLSVHDVEVKKKIPRDELLENWQRGKQGRQHILELMKKQDKELQEEIENIDKNIVDSMSDMVSKSRRVYSHVLFDQDIDESVFEFPAQSQAGENWHLKAPLKILGAGNAPPRADPT